MLIRLATIFILIFFPIWGFSDGSTRENICQPCRIFSLQWHPRVRVAKQTRRSGDDWMQNFIFLQYLQFSQS